MHVHIVASCFARAHCGTVVRQSYVYILFSLGCMIAGGKVFCKDVMKQVRCAAVNNVRLLPHSMYNHT